MELICNLEIFGHFYSFSDSQIRLILSLRTIAFKLIKKVIFNLFSSVIFDFHTAKIKERNCRSCTIKSFYMYLFSSEIQQHSQLNIVNFVY